MRMLTEKLKAGSNSGAWVRTGEKGAATPIPKTSP